MKKIVNFERKIFFSWPCSTRYKKTNMFACCTVRMSKSFAERKTRGLIFAERKTRGLIFAEKTRGKRFSARQGTEVVCEVYDMKFILGGVLEYRNADCRLQHIHEHDVTSSLKGKRGKTFQKGKREKIFRFVQFRVFSFGRIHQKIARTMQTTLSSRASRQSASTLVLGSIYHRCSGSAMFTCFGQGTIPRMWKDERIFRKH